MDKASDGSDNLRFRPNRTFICSVVFLDIVEYSKKSVEEQIRLKEHFNALLSEAIKNIAVNDRIILDTGDGAAIGFLGDPEDALFVAMSLQDALSSETSEVDQLLHVRIGINLGPVKLLKDINKQLNLIGDGINVAQRIMSFAEPGQLLVSRSFYDVVSCLSQEYARLFQYLGARADKHVREHDVYSVEHSGVRPIPAHQRHEGAKSISTATGADSIHKSDNKEIVPDAEAVSTRIHGWNAKKMLSVGGPILAVVIGLVVFFMYRDKVPEKSIKETASVIKSDKSPASTMATSAAVSPTHSESAAKPDEAQSKPVYEAFKAASFKADDIVFTLTGFKESGKKVTFTIKTRNKSKVDKSIALYDDAFRWTKSKITDSAGKTKDVSNVTFHKGGQKTAMSAAGSRGIIVAPNETITTYLTFNKESLKQIKSLNLHPFIYEGRSWHEHNLAFKSSR